MTVLSGGKRELLAAFAGIALGGGAVWFALSHSRPPPVEPEQLKWQVFIQASSSCGGVIVAENWVLTAAHCVRSNEPITQRAAETASREEMKLLQMNGVYAGGKKFDDTTEVLSCERPIVHNDYVYRPNTASKHDLALMHVRLPIDSSIDVVQLASVAEESEAIEAFVARTYCPWCGQHEINYVKVKVLPRSSCEPEFICAGNGMFIDGDSGSGLTTSVEAGAKLVGIVNHRHSLALVPIERDKYARIAIQENRDFITGVINFHTYMPHGENDCRKE